MLNVRCWILNDGWDVFSHAIFMHNVFPIKLSMSKKKNVCALHVFNFYFHFITKMSISDKVHIMLELTQVCGKTWGMTEARCTFYNSWSDPWWHLTCRVGFLELLCQLLSMHLKKWAIIKFQSLDKRNELKFQWNFW